ncbi:MAG: hypothetical protein JWN34_5738 [Bryobacterales bacterium]|nr:hypothetical protein [Bryobacterales bacterium]
MKTTILAVMALLCSSLAALAADVTGKWTAEIPGGRGPSTATFNFKAAGAKLEGTVTTVRQGNPVESAISDGKVDGDKISFVQTMQMQGNEVKLNYTGVIKGDTIEMTREGGRGPATFTAKKAQ